MVKLWAVIYTLVVTAGAVVVQGASLAVRDEPCAPPNDDYGHVKCETSGGSPLVSDCQSAIDALSDDTVCYQSNDNGSHCTTIKRWGTCKIDVCGRPDAKLYPEKNGALATRCKIYLKNLLHDCKSGAVVGGQIFPQMCNVDYHYDPVIDPEYKNSARYRVQFSHH